MIIVKTTRWQDSYWNDLHPYPKIVLCYIYDNCNNSGIIEFNSNLWLTQLKGKLDKRYPEFTKEDLLNSLSDLKEKLVSDGKKKLFIKDFLKHQMKLPLKKGNLEDNQIILNLQSNLQRFNNAPEILEILNNVEEEKKVEPIKKTTKVKKNTTEFIAPTIEEFVDFFVENGYRKDIGEKAWNGYNDAKWHDSKGTKVFSWKQKVRNNWFNPENKEGSDSKGDKKSKLQTTMSVVAEMTRNPNQ
jgi:hypothetical protein